jgi:hypothetical protein
MKPTPGKVDIINRQANDLALTAAATGSDVDHRGVALPQRSPNRTYSGEFPRNYFSLFGPRRYHRFGHTRIFYDAFVIDRSIQDCT